MIKNGNVISSRCFSNVGAFFGRTCASRAGLDLLMAVLLFAPFDLCVGFSAGLSVACSVGLAFPVWGNFFAVSFASSHVKIIFLCLGREGKGTPWERTPSGRGTPWEVCGFAESVLRHCTFASSCATNDACLPSCPVKFAMPLKARKN